VHEELKQWAADVEKATFVGYGRRLVCERWPEGVVLIQALGWPKKRSWEGDRPDVLRKNVSMAPGLPICIKDLREPYPPVLR
jgi:hypothetical protein